MNEMPSVSPNGGSKPVDPPEPKKRLRIDKLEERIAPKRGGNTKNCAGSAGTLTSGGTYY